MQLDFGWYVGPKESFVYFQPARAIIKSIQETKFCNFKKGDQINEVLIARNSISAFQRC